MGKIIDFRNNVKSNNDVIGKFKDSESPNALSKRDLDNYLDNPYFDAGITYHNTALDYYYGNGVELNYLEAAKWFKRAIQARNIESMYNLGHMYIYTPLGTYEKLSGDECFQKAYDYMKMAADKGYEDAKSAVVNLLAMDTKSRIRA